MMKNLIGLFYLLSLVNSLSTEGCLRFLNGECKICDTSRFYFTDENGGCELNVIENCQIPNFNGKYGEGSCLRCAQGYYLSNIKNLCVPVPQTQSDQNCIHYSQLAECMECNTGYIITNGVCSTPDNKISNCEVQISETVCDQCKEGYFVQNNECKSISSSSNCVVESEFICNKCKSSYNLSINNYALTLLNNDAYTYIPDKSNRYQESYLSSFAYEECTKQNIDNCVKYNSFGRCSECEPKFHINTQTGYCNRSPEPSIFQCSVYSSLTTCSKCNKGYYLKNNECLLQEMQDLCKEYKVDSIGCAVCMDNYYSSSGVCFLRNRSLSVAHCVTLKNDKDECDICEKGYILSSDSGKCFIPVPHCLEHKPTASSDALLCKTCAVSTIPTPDVDNATSCVLRNNEGCQEFTDNTNTCVSCVREYYNNDGICIKRTKSCKEGNLTLDECSTCYDHHYLDPTSKECKRHSKINCKEYSTNSDECNNCNVGFYVSDNTKDCLPYSLENCLTPNTGKNECNSCKSGYYPVSPTVCKKFDLLGCDSHDANTNTCQQCLSGYYKNSENLCEPHILRGCTSNGRSKTAHECSECAPGFYLNANQCHPYTVTNCKNLETDSDACTANNCETGYQFEDPKCLLIPVANCETYDFANKQCTTCATDYYPVNGNCQPQYNEGCSSYTPNTNDCATCYDGYKLNSNKCDKNLLTYCIEEDTTTGLCTKCSEGFKVESGLCVLNNMLGCKTFDTSGVCNEAITPYFILSGSTPVRNYIENCIEYNDSDPGKCLTCAPNTFLSSDNKSCVIPNHIEDCIKYLNPSTCGMCKTLKHTIGSSCTPISHLEGCFYSDGVNGSCLECIPNYYYHLGDTKCKPILTDTNKVYGNCLKNTSTLTDVPCSECKDRNYMVFVDKLIKEIPEYCESVGLNGVCTQWARGWEYKNSKISKIDFENSACGQLNGFEEVLIDASGKCKECISYETHYLNSSNNCVARTTSKHKCYLYDKNNDLCKACPEGVKTSDSNECKTEQAANATEKGNCKYTALNGRCFECLNGYIVEDATGTCITIPSNLTSNCKSLTNTTDNTCNSCIDGFMLDGGTCHSSKNCLVRNSSNGKCQVCESNYVFDTNSDYGCVAGSYDSPCEIFTHPLGLSETNSYCIKCRGDDSISIINKNVATNNIANYNCVKADENQLANTAFYYDGSKYVMFTSTVYSPRVYFADSTSGFTINNSLIPQYRCIDMEIDNCQTVGTKGASDDAVCTKCNSGYYLKDVDYHNKICVAGGISGCLDYSDFETCTSCKQGFTLKDNECTESFVLEGCADSYGEGTVCNQCENGYILLNGQCHKQFLENCRFSDALGISCIDCTDNFYLSQGTCHPYTIENCEKFLWSEDACLECKQGYYNSKGHCLKNTSLNCKKLSILENKCLECEENYYLSLERGATDDEKTKTSGECYLRFTDPYCLRFKITENECEVCKDGYYKSMNQNLCVKYTVKNCLEKAVSHDGCIKCLDGFYLNQEGFCMKHSIKNCKKYSQRNDACEQCNYGYYLNNLFTCSKHTVENCDLFNTHSDTCLSCISGHYLYSSTTCRKYQNNNNCKRMHSDEDLCSECKDGFFNNKGLCVARIVQNCLKYKADEDLCLTCESGYFIQSNACLSYTVNCKDYNPFSNSCLTCLEGYFLYEGNCYINDALNCKYYSSIRRGCEACNDSDYLDLNSGSCLSRLKSTNCAKAILTSDLCETCPSTHYFAAGICYSRKTNNCATFDPVTDVCTSCHENKNWYSFGICEEYTIDNCEIYQKDADLCEECISGSYYLGNDKLCHPSSPVPNCKLYSNTVDECVSCNDGFYLASSSECRPNPTGLFNCIEYKDENTCTKCTSGYYLKDNFCFKSKFKINFCDVYSDNITCQACLSGNVLVNNPAPDADDTEALAVGHPDRPLKICVPVNNSTCTEWEDADNCSSCSGNEVLGTNSDNNKECVASGLSNCVEASGTSSSKKCVKCEDGYFINSSNECEAPESQIDKCKRYESATKCSECETGYYVNSDKIACETIEDPMNKNCDNGYKSVNKICKACAPNYYLNDENECVKCGGDNCDVCDPYDTSKCWLCLPGYEHDGTSCNKPAIKSDDGMSGVVVESEGNANIRESNYESIFNKNILGFILLSFATIMNK